MSNADIRGRFMWHELMTTDTDAAGAFYSKVMPWKTQASGMPGYTLWYAGKTQAGGLMALNQQSQASGPHWLTYIGTPSVDSSVESVQRLGGKVLKGAADIPNVGRFAVVSDPQGAAFALYTPASSSSDGAGPGGAAPGGSSWHELATSNLDGAVAFYTELFGWEKGPGHDMGGDVGVYQIITQGGRQIGGMFKSPQASMAPYWLTYVHVADIDKAANAVKGGGGRIMNGPHQVPGGSWILQATDPQGGMFAVIEPAEMAAAEKPAAQAAKPASKPAAPKAAAPAPAASAVKEVKPAAVAPAAPKAAAPKPTPRKAAAKTGRKVAKKAAAKKATNKAAKKAAKKAKPSKKGATAKRGVAKRASSARGARKTAAKGKAKPRVKSRVRAKGKRR